MHRYLVSVTIRIKYLWNGVEKLHEVDDNGLRGERRGAERSGEQSSHFGGAPVERRLRHWAKRRSRAVQRAAHWQRPAAQRERPLRRGGRVARDDRREHDEAREEREAERRRRPARAPPEHLHERHVVREGKRHVCQRAEQPGQCDLRTIICREVVRMYE